MSREILARGHFYLSHLMSLYQLSSTTVGTSIALSILKKEQFIMQSPTIEKFMTAHTHTIGAEQPLSKALKMMTENRIRHLAVLQDRHLVGILSERDIQLVETFKDVDPEKVSVEEAYTPDPFIVSPDSDFSEVCRKMAAHKYGCAVVLDNKKLVGMFTWIDALNALPNLIKEM